DAGLQRLFARRDVSRSCLSCPGPSSMLDGARACRDGGRWTSLVPPGRFAMSNSRFRDEARAALRAVALPQGGAGFGPSPCLAQLAGGLFPTSGPFSVSAVQRQLAAP